jgi:hypothetical protein
MRATRKTKKSSKKSFANFYKKTLKQVINITKSAINTSRKAIVDIIKKANSRGK